MMVKPTMLGGASCVGSTYGELQWKKMINLAGSCGLAGAADK